jgi:hypothetical protein
MGNTVTYVSKSSPGWTVFISLDVMKLVSKKMCATPGNSGYSVVFVVLAVIVNELEFISQSSKTRNKKQGTRNKEQGTRNKEQGTRNKEQGTRNKEQGTRNKEQGTRDKKDKKDKTGKTNKKTKETKETRKGRYSPLR